MTKLYIQDNNLVTQENLNSQLGPISQLPTTDKSNIVSAVNEIYNNVNSGKQKLATAITNKGVSTAANATFDKMVTNINNIKTGVSFPITFGSAQKVTLNKVFTGPWGTETTSSVTLGNLSSIIPNYSKVAKITAVDFGFSFQNEACSFNDKPTNTFPIDFFTVTSTGISYGHSGTKELIGKVYGGYPNSLDFNIRISGNNLIAVFNSPEYNFVIDSITFRSVTVSYF